MTPRKPTYMRLLIFVILLLPAIAWAQPSPPPLPSGRTMTVNGQQVGGPDYNVMALGQVLSETMQGYVAARAAIARLNVELEAAKNVSQSPSPSSTAANPPDKGAENLLGRIKQLDGQLAQAKIDLDAARARIAELEAAAKPSAEPPK